MRVDAALWPLRVFLSTLPARGATAGKLSSTATGIFLSTLPARGATVPPPGMPWRLWTFLSTLPARGATAVHRQLQGAGGISIHAPREGSDPKPCAGPHDEHEISIHAPREGSDWPPLRTQSAAAYFYPRSPRGERLCPRRLTPTRTYFYPRSPRGERPDLPHDWGAFQHFYPRSPRGERHSGPKGRASRAADFYPRSPRGERRGRCGCNRWRWSHFYPRSPRGERRPTSPRPCRAFYFYPRSPRGERPAAAVVTAGDGAISIHAPREGSDDDLRPTGGPNYKFLSTLPARGATGHSHLHQQGRGHFYPRSPRGERPCTWSLFSRQQIFLSTLPARGATAEDVQADFDVW